MMLRAQSSELREGSTEHRAQGKPFYPVPCALSFFPCALCPVPCAFSPEPSALCPATKAGRLLKRFPYLLQRHTKAKHRCPVEKLFIACEVDRDLAVGDAFTGSERSSRGGGFEFIKRAHL